jgi:hypothetical protein
MRCRASLVVSFSAMREIVPMVRALRDRTVVVLALLLVGGAGSQQEAEESSGHSMSTTIDRWSSLMIWHPTRI